MQSVRLGSAADAAKRRETSVRRDGSASIRPSSMRPKFQCGCVRHSGGETFADSCGHATSYRHPSGIRPSIQDAVMCNPSRDQTSIRRVISSPHPGGVSVMGHFRLFRRTHSASIHSFEAAEDRLFTATFALEYRPMDIPGRQRVGLPCSTRGPRYPYLPSSLNSLLQ